MVAGNYSIISASNSSAALLLLIYRNPVDAGSYTAVVARGVADLYMDTQPVIRAIGVSHTACKDEFRQNLRSHSWRVFLFL